MLFPGSSFSGFFCIGKCLGICLENLRLSHTIDVVTAFCFFLRIHLIVGFDVDDDFCADITDDGSQSVGDTGFLWNKTGGSKESCYFREKDMDRCTDPHQYRIGLKTCLDQMIRVVLSVFGKTETFFCQKVDLIRVGIAFCLAETIFQQNADDVFVKFFSTSSYTSAGISSGV